jgi:uncharacterized protein YycO
MKIFYISLLSFLLLFSISFSFDFSSGKANAETEEEVVDFNVSSNEAQNLIDYGRKLYYPDFADDPEDTAPVVSDEQEFEDALDGNQRLNDEFEKEMNEALEHLENWDDEVDVVEGDDKNNNGFSTQSYSLYGIGSVGDILYTPDPDSSKGMFRHGHVGIVHAKKQYTVESFPRTSETANGVWFYKNTWKNRYVNVKGLRVVGASYNQYKKAADYAALQYGKPYCFCTSKYTTQAFYCSQLVWRAWQKAGYNLDANGGDIVTPKNIYDSSRTYRFYTQSKRVK